MSSARIEELRKKFEENPRRYFAPLANEYRKAGDFDQAIFICQEYLPQQPGHMSGHIVFGQALFEAKRLPEAKTVFETALSLDPENLIALRHLADISRDIGDSTAAKGWYERVLQADPRNEEVLDIVARLDSGRPTPATPSPAATAAAARTAEAPTATAPARTHPDASSAPTVELSAAQVQEMLKARQASKPPAERITEPEVVEPMTLDTTPTVEIRAEEAMAMEGLEPTSHQGGLDLPAIEPLGLETNAAPGLHTEAAVADAAPLDGLDTIPLEISLPSTPPPSRAEAPTAEVPPASGEDLLDLGSFGLPAASPTAPTPAEAPVDGGHDGGLIDLDFAAPTETAPPQQPEAESLPTVVMDAVKSVVPAVQDAVESAAPALLDFVETAVPSMVEAVKSTVEAVAETPTLIVEAIKTSAAKPEPPAPPTPSDPPRTSQSVPFVTETMAQLYLSQGHRAEAIDIYRKLIEARPNDRELQSRLSAIEKEPAPVVAAQAPAMPATTPVQPVQASTPAPRRFAGSGPSIRVVLRELFGFDGSASYAAGSVTQSPLPAEVGSIDMLFSTSPVAEALSPLAVAFDGGYVASQGSIDALFAGGPS